MERMQNIYVNIDELNGLITTLNEDNENIFDIIDTINKNMMDIDETKWKSPERKKFDELFIPYINKKEKSIKMDLNSCKDKLVIAKNNYLGINIRNGE